MKAPRYDAFISYSSADGHIAAQLQRALHRIATPWYRLRGMRIFRDSTDLTATPEGWSSIRNALDHSRYLIFLASTQAAQSHWVAKEVLYWLDHRILETFLIVITNGEILWDAETNDFDWQRTTSLPKELAGRFRGEPFWADLRWAREGQALTLRNQKYLNAVAKVAAPIRQLEVENLVSEDRRQHRRTLRIAYGAIAIIIASLLITLWFEQRRRVAVQQERDQHVLAAVALAYRSLYSDPLQAVDEVRDALTVRSNTQTDEALKTALSVARQRQASRNNERQVLGSGVGYLMERWRQSEVFTRLRRDGQFALVASERGKDGPNPPGNAYLIRLDNLRTIELQPGDDAKDRRLEHLGFSFAGDEVFVARQFYLDIFDLTGARTKSVQLEYHAKPTHLIAGKFGSFVLVGDTVGNLMLADTLSNQRPQFAGGRYPDAAVIIESNATNNRAAVIFESGRVDLLILDDLPRVVKEPRKFQHQLSTKGTIHAAFAPAPQTERLLLSTREGQIEVWDSHAGVPTRMASFKHGDVPVGLASFSRDGKRVISLSEDGSCKVWNLGESEPLAIY